MHFESIINLTYDHVSIAVSVERGPEAEPVLNFHHPVHQVGGIGQVGVRMSASEIFENVRFKEAFS